MLTDAAIRRIKPGPKPFKKADSLGLYMLVQTSGSRLWRFNYTHGGRQRTLALGVYPEVSLSEAREHRDAAKRQLRFKQDPGVIVRVEKAAEKLAVANTFRAVAAQWQKTKIIAEGKSKSTLERVRWLLGILNEGIGDQPIGEIEAPDLLVVLRRIEAQGKHEAVKRLRSTASAIFRFGIAIGVCKRDPAADLKGALTTAKSTPHAAITEPADVGELLRAINNYERPTLRLALQLLALTFVRPGNVCSAQWSEFQIDAGVWNIPAAKMKMRDAFRVPLSKQALVVLKELHAITGKSRYLFPSLRKGDRPLFTYQLNIALRGIGYASDEMQAHGFRSVFSTLANEHSDFSSDVIELALAHRPGGVRSIYNRAKYWTERCTLVQWYADYLDQLRDRGKVVPLAKPKRRKV